MNTGVPTYAFKGTNREFTPPGITSCAREKSAVDFVMIFNPYIKSGHIVPKLNLRKILCADFPLCYPLQKIFRIKLC